MDDSNRNFLRNEGHTYMNGQRSSKKDTGGAPAAPTTVGILGRISWPRTHAEGVVSKLAETAHQYVNEAEAALIAGCLAGEQTAWEAFISRYQSRVYNVTYYMTQDAERAADLAQEALVQILRSLPQFRGESSLTTWIHGLTIRVCLHQLRRERRRQADSWEEIKGGQAEPASMDEGPWETLHRRQIQRLVRQGIAQLPLPFRAVMVLHGLAGLTYEETARALKLPVNTVKTRVHRAKAKLKAWLEKHEGDGLEAL